MVASEAARYRIVKEETDLKVWSEVRLPFEPKLWLLQLRNEIRLALNALEPTAEPFYACFSSADRRPCDAENILFYNVGPSYFRRFVTNGLVFERCLELQADQPGPLRYLMHYSTSKVARPCWQPSSRHLECETTLQLDRRGRPLLDVASVWLAFKRASRVFRLQGNMPTRYGLTLRLGVPTNVTIDLALHLKGLLDGAISALHSYKGSRLDEVSVRLASKLSQAPIAVSTLLLNDGMAVLGARETLWPYRESVQWNPADDFCYHCEIVLTPGNWDVSMSVFEVSPAAT